jgi:hypothetical protein
MSDPHAHTRPEQPEHVAELLRAVDVRAPERLHYRVREMTTQQRHHRRRDQGPIAARCKPALVAMAVTAAAVGGAIALLSSAATRQQSPSVGEASALTLRAATMAAPSESAAHAAQLNVAVDGVAFPYWQERFGWRASGARTDTVGGRKVTTVFYSNPAGSRIGYAIVGGTPAPSTTTSGGTVSWRDGVAYRLSHTHHGVPVVTWQRDGRLCVLSGHGVPSATLLRLASWSERDASAS